MDKQDSGSQSLGLETELSNMQVSATSLVESETAQVDSKVAKATELVDYEITDSTSLVVYRNIAEPASQANYEITKVSLGVEAAESENAETKSAELDGGEGELRFDYAEKEQDPPPPYSTFTCFSKLPTELRLKIWGYNLPGPRIVVVIFNSDRYQPNKLTTNAVMPVNLHVNQESRLEALKMYKLCMATDDRYEHGGFGLEDERYIPASRPHLEPRIYLSYELDTVIFSAYDFHKVDVVVEPSFFYKLRDEDLQQIQNMMVILPTLQRLPRPTLLFTDERDRLQNNTTADSLFPHRIKLLRSLKKITILYADLWHIDVDRVFDKSFCHSPIDELEVGDQDIARFFCDHPDIPGQSQARLDGFIDELEGHLGGHFGLGDMGYPWKEVPVVTVAKTRDNSFCIRSILDLTF